MFNFDPATYAVGDTIWLAVPDGWDTHCVVAYTVSKKTSSGQITADAGLKQIRINKHGTIIGADRWNRDRIVTAERAAELRVETTVRSAWTAMRLAIAAVDSAARTKDRPSLDKAMADLLAAITRLPKEPAP